MSEVKVLIPLDGSQNAEAALTLLPIVESLGTPYIRMIGVVDQSSIVGLPNAQERIQREERLVESYLRDQKAKLDRAGQTIDYEVKVGLPADAIIEAAKRFEAQYIVLTTHGRSGIARWSLGSVADKVIRGAVCDVLIAGPANQRFNVEGGASILVPLDGSGFAEQALPVAMKVKEALKGTLHVVRVITFPSFVDDAGYALEAARESAEAYIGDLERKLGTDGIVFDTTSGDAADELLKYARQHHVALTVMTSHGRTGFMRAALGSVTDRMLGGHNPILVVKSHDDSEGRG